MELHNDGYYYSSDRRYTKEEYDLIVAAESEVENADLLQLTKKIQL